MVRPIKRYLGGEMEQQEKFNVFEVKCSDKEYQQICEPRLTKEFFDDCLKTAQQLKMQRRNVLKKKIKIISLITIMVIIGMTKIICADEISEQTLNPLEVWHDDLTQFTKNIKPPEPTLEVQINEQVVLIAKQYLGVPYVWGGTTPAGFDCSGLVQYIYNQLGFDLTRTTYTQVNEGSEVQRSNLRQGDLVFFKRNNDIHHVGIYIGNNQFIHAPQTGEAIKISNLSDRNDYYTARRIIND